ncbi:UNVERIFIED_CONTAM: hypothetical protein RMT77_010125 [Armadillidium vulgare]
MHSKVLTKIVKRINEASNVSFTTDIWTNNADASFIRLTTNCIYENFSQSWVVFRVKPFPDARTSSNICNMIGEVMDDYKITPYKAHMIVVDNPANIVKGVTDTGFKSLNVFFTPTNWLLPSNNRTFQ